MSTTETTFKAPNHQMFVVWLQKDHTVNDQVFKPYAIYPAGERKYITTSRRRKTEHAGQQGDGKLEQFTFFGALIALIGFISQFIGMRGLNWTASIVQLGITFVVTMIRVIVRRGLGKSPIRTPLQSNTELDWFSLTFGRLATAPWAVVEGKPPNVNKHVALTDENAPKWSICTGRHQPYYPLKKPDRDSIKAMESSTAHKTMVIREWLCTLLRWKSTASEEAALLSRAIEAVAQELLEGFAGQKLVWGVPAFYEESPESVFIELNNINGTWHVKSHELDAMLSLWLFSTPAAKGPQKDRCVKLRVFGSTGLWPRLRRDLQWWMPDFVPLVFERTMSQISELRGTVVGFTSEPTSEMDRSDKTGDTTNKPGKVTADDERYLVIESEDSWGRFYSRDLLFAFIRSVAKMPEVTLEGAFRKRPVGGYETKEGWDRMQLGNGRIVSLTRELEKIGFGTLADIYFDLIMPLSLELKLTNIKDIIDKEIEKAQQQELTRRWEQLVNTCCSLLDLAHKFDLDKEASGPLAVAACIEFLYRLCHEADLQRREGRSEEELSIQLAILEEKFTTMRKGLEASTVFSGIISDLPKTWDYTTTFGLLIGIEPDAPKQLPTSFNVVDEREKLTQNSLWEKTSYWGEDELTKVDSFGWSPLHYAASLKLDHLRIVFAERGKILSPQDFMGRTPLHHACLSGNEKVVDLLLDRDAPVEVAGNDGMTAIHCAVVNGNLEILKKVVEKLDSQRLQNARKSILHVDRNKRHPVHWAAAQGRIDMVQLFKEDILLTDWFGWACIHLAAIYNHVPLLEYIIKHSTTDIDLCDKHAQTPLQLAAKNMSSGTVDSLIKNGANVKAKDNDGLTPLHMAFEQGGIALKLIKSGADVNATDIEGRTTLLLASNGITDVTDILIRHGADVTIATKAGRTPLHMAIRSKVITEKLLEHKAAINAKDIEGYTPLYLAAMEGTAEVAALLIDKGAEVAIAAEDGSTPLHMALSRGKDGLEIAKKLLNFDPNVKIHNPYVNTKAEGDTFPLHIAAEHGPPEAVEMLLHLGADKNQTDGYGQTALLISIYNDNWDIADLLLAARADIKADSRVGYTPLLGAVMGKQKRIVEQLLRMRADVNAVDEDGYSPIHLAVSRGDSYIFEQLFDANANLDAVTKFNSQTPLHIAVRRGDRAMVQTLLEKGADTKPLNNIGFTPLQYAVSRGNLKIVQEFVQHDKFSAPTVPKAALQKGDSGNTPLHTLCRYASLQNDGTQMREMLEGLLSVASQTDTINAVNDDGLTPLDLARSSMSEDSDFVKFLIEKGAKPSDKPQTEDSLRPLTSSNTEQGVP